MSKIIDTYHSNKIKDNQKIYLFKSGIFYYFLDDDARYINKKYNFKLTSFGNTVKCGFPVKSLEKYLYIFNKESIELVQDKESNNEKIINIIKNINLNEISPKDAYMILSEIKELYEK